MTKIFISYRRTDSPDATGRIFDHLTFHFSKDVVFKDVDSIPLGMDFRKSISDAIQACDVVLAVIGRNWLCSKDKRGNLRLSNLDDFVRIELEESLNRDIPVIPVLVSGADMPTMEEMPKTLHPLVYRNAISLRPDPDFNVDIQKLIRRISEILQKQTTTKNMFIAFTVRTLTSRFRALERKLRSQFIIYIVIAVTLVCLSIGAYVGYGRLFLPGLDQCNSLNPPVSCLFKER